MARNSKNLDLAEHLLANGANPNITNNVKHTPLQYATTPGREGRWELDGEEQADQYRTWGTGVPVVQRFLPLFAMVVGSISRPPSLVQGVSAVCKKTSQGKAAPGMASFWVFLARVQSNMHDVTTALNEDVIAAVSGPLDVIVTHRCNWATCGVGQGNCNSAVLQVASYAAKVATSLP